jgi:hypothetical protein
LGLGQDLVPVALTKMAQVERRERIGHCHRNQRPGFTSTKVLFRQERRQRTFEAREIENLRLIPRHIAVRMRPIARQNPDPA